VDVSQSDLLTLYRFMLTARCVEEMLGKLPGFHPAVGEEAVPIGSFFGLKEGDYIAPHYRGAITAAYMRGADLRTLFAGVLGKATSHNLGRFRGDICMPIAYRVIGMYSGVLGSTISLATGAALSARVLRSDNVAVVSFGEGCSNLGAFHENINLAATLDLPVVYICQNNQFAMSTRATQSMRCSSVADRAIGYGIPGIRVDGNDVLAVHSAVQKAVSRARSHGGPTLIEALTYRVSGHYGSEQPTYQNADERESWKKRDPLARFQNHLESLALLDPATASQLADATRAMLSAAMNLARADPEPGHAELGEHQLFATPQAAAF
jgi:TPP-dependent pyruvate/acetoin dehydrogenase alpha subunit